MAKTVVGLYDAESDARGAVDELKRQGFDQYPVHLETHGAGEPAITKEEDQDLLDALERAGVPHDEAEFYSEGIRRGGSLVIVEAPDEWADEAARLMNVHEPVRREERESRWRERGYQGYERQSERLSAEEAEAERQRYRTARGEEEEARLTEAREEVHVGKREVAGGGARIHKRVVEHPFEETVYLREEEVDVERRPASETTPTEDVFKEETIEMSETREEPVVQKETRVEGEVVVKKEARERPETVRETIRETRIDVERFGEDIDEYEADFRSHYEVAYAEADYDYADYEPAYRYGYAYGAHEDYADYTYADVEPEMQRHYEEKHGKGTWQRVKDAVRHAFHRARS